MTPFPLVLLSLCAMKALPRLSVPEEVKPGGKGLAQVTEPGRVELA